MKFAILFAALLIGGQALAAETEFMLVIKDHQFEPKELSVPAGEALKLIVENQDATPEEFESHDLNLEKIVPGNSKITLRVGPLEPGTYSFVGEFNEDTAKGQLVVK